MKQLMIQCTRNGYCVKSMQNSTSPCVKCPMYACYFPSFHMRLFWWYVSDHKLCIDIHTYDEQISNGLTCHKKVENTRREEVWSFTMGPVSLNQASFILISTTRTELGNCLLAFSHCNKVSARVKALMNALLRDARNNSSNKLSCIFKSHQHV